MAEEKPYSGALVLPEYCDTASLFRTLVDKVIQNGKPQMATALLTDQLGAVVVVCSQEQAIHFSRVLKAIASSPIVPLMRN